MSSKKTYLHRSKPYELSWDEKQITIIHPDGKFNFEVFNANTSPPQMTLDARENLHHRYFGPDGYELRTAVNPSMRVNGSTFDLGIITPKKSGGLKDSPPELFKDIKKLLNV